MVITKQALIIKATKKDVKNKNDEIRNINKTIEKSKRVRPLKIIYQIIPWEYYSPMDYEIKIREDKKGHETFIFRAGDTDIGEFRSENLYRLFQKYNTTILEEQRKAEEIIENATFSSVNSISVEGTMFNSAYGADQTKTGHGIYAEEAGARLDILAGEKSTVIGRDNAKNGPDKIVDTAPVQCKYCKTAYSSIESCFRKDSSGTKSFRYFDLNGNPMKIEVPADQYAQAIDYMKKSIRNGQVPGVTDPNAAYDIIRKGDYRTTKL